MLDLYEELAAIVAALENRQIPYALCGGLALAVWGLPRATVDIDLLIEPSAVDDVEAVAESLGYKFRARPMTFSDGAITIRRITKVDPAGDDPLMLDMLLVTPATRDVWESREQVAWERGSIWVVSRSGLVKLKMFRRSGTDLDDISRLQETE